MVDYPPDFNDIVEKMTKLQKLLRDGVTDKDVLRYLPGMFPLAYQGMIYTVKTKSVGWFNIQRFSDAGVQHKITSESIYELEQCTYLSPYSN